MSSGRKSAFKSAIAAVALTLVAVSGCSHRYLPMPNGDFEGIAESGARARIVRIFVIHGMGDHSPGYSNALVSKLAERAVLRAVGAREDRQIQYRGGAVVVGNLRKTTYVGVASREEYRVYEMTWSPLTMPIKDRYLNYDREPEYELKRAMVNKALKEGLVDRALSDAILYVGEFGDAMRWTVTQGICQMLNDTYAGNGLCELGGVDVPDLEADQIVLVSASLGSRMLFDSLLALLANAESQAAAEKALARTNLVFMLANQLSLLALANVAEPEGVSNSASAFGAAPPKDTGLSGFVRTWSLIQRDRAKAMLTPEDAASRPLRIIAFSDPNDLLSFRLRRDAASGRKDVELIDVTVSNVPEIFGIIARPDKAHTAYGDNDGVLDLMVCGSKGLRAACN